ncbi:MarR family transcriptional regulator [Saccharopolyspora sp. WRP15-2]|uniref:MarR family transcriptional regulator n=1 Tax=Saccharopolyspora oryzae TaxID=2997343 RepID=A0ABT4UYJ2_9PSEU|nr:MarR family transcriptional regulator [Saccharopolyspora oryzae]MDA3626790.1 MarR family transcriptional regulator [Saccharopolyspora oryzae]
MSQEDVRERVGYLIKQAQQSFHRSCEERLRPLGLSMSQYAVLRALADAPGAPAAELARRTFVTRQSLRDVLNGLRAAGLASVSDQPTSGRARPVSLTDRGRALLGEAHSIVLAVEDRMTADLAPDDVRRLAALLSTCVASLG